MILEFRLNYIHDVKRYVKHTLNLSQDYRVDNLIIISLKVLSPNPSPKERGANERVQFDKN